MRVTEIHNKGYSYEIMCLYHNTIHLINVCRKVLTRKVFIIPGSDSIVHQDMLPNLLSQTKKDENHQIK